MSDIKMEHTARRKRRMSPERIANQVRETANRFNAALERARAEGMEVINADEQSAKALVIKEIRINKTV